MPRTIDVMSTGAPIDDAGHIVLVPSDPDWPELYSTIRDGVLGALGPAARSIHHVGSTSVPGLAAKPVIDVVLTLEDPDDEDTYVPPLAVVGYEVAVREPDWYRHRCLKRSDPWVNLHVFPHGCPELDRMLRFRDRLRSDPTDRATYQAEKERLAVHRWDEVQQYADAKTDVVARILRAGPTETRP
jgi:GrpB-like predicted nucleotidyltransferase (UPF0157 family)